MGRAGRWLAAGPAAAWLLGCLAAAGAADLPAMHRRPCALVLDAAGRLLVANGRSGSISVVDPAEQRVQAEFPVGRTLTDLAALPGLEEFLATDAGTHEVLLVGWSGGRLEVRERLAVPPHPVSVAATGLPGRWSVAGLWSRRLALVEVRAGGGGPRMAKVGQIDLDFPPRLQAAFGPDRLVVADAFGDRLAVIDPAAGRLEFERQVAGHNLRGLAIGPEGSLLMAHQVLHAEHPTTWEGVFWGGVLKNVVRSVTWEELLAPPRPYQPLGELYFLGEPNGATGDPAAIVVAPGQRTAVALSGVNEVAVRPTRNEPYVRVGVGLRPVAVAADPVRPVVYVANALGDSVSIVDASLARPLGDIPLGPAGPWTAADRGELIFHDARRSLGGWFSCQSCHPDGHTAGQRNDNASDGGFGAPKQIPSLLGVARTGPWAWQGHRTSLAEQLRKSVQDTMQGRELDDNDVAHLAAYLETLEPPPSAARLRGTERPAAVARGAAVFRRQGCDQCHAPPQFTTPDAYDVDLADELGNRRFNPPSLRGAGQRPRFFHDGRAGSLAEVVGRLRHGLSQPLSAEERADLLEFLGSL